MHSGTIKFFNAGKGFGFVTPDGGNSDIFLPAAALTASGLESVKQGQRVSFEQVPDTKGPKITALKILEDAPPPKPAPPPADRVNVYCDPNSDITADVLNEVQAAGYQVQLHDYVSAPPELEQMRRLSHMLNEAGQSLVRRYDPLFLALQLDDRFISDQDFWTGIAEHPGLINGPVLQHGGKARICRSGEDATAFLNKKADIAPHPKALSPRMAAMLKGQDLLPAPAPPSPAPVASASVAAVAELAPQAKSSPKPAKDVAAKTAPAKVAAAKTVVARRAPKPAPKVVVNPRAAAPEKKTATVKKTVKPVKAAKKSPKK